MFILLSGSDGHVILNVHHVIGFCGDVYLVKLLLKTICNEFYQYERNHGIYLGNPKINFWWESLVKKNYLTFDISTEILSPSILMPFNSLQASSASLLSSNSIKAKNRIYDIYSLLIVPLRYHHIWENTIKLTITSLDINFNDSSHITEGILQIITPYPTWQISNENRVTVFSHTKINNYFYLSLMSHAICKCMAGQ